jgi:hypothetical protein
MKRAMFIKKVKLGKSDALLYKLSDPIKFMNEGKECGVFDVVVSAVTNHVGTKQAFIFPSDKDGNVISMMELPGSQKGTLDHEAALEAAGYEVM